MMNGVPGWRLLVALFVIFSSFPLRALAQSACTAPPGLIVLGDSVALGFGAADPATQGFAALMAPSFGGTLTNLGVSGYLAVDMTVLAVYPSLRRTVKSPSIAVLVGINDANENGAGADLEAIFNRSLQASLAFMAIPHSSSMVYGQDAACSPLTPGWSADSSIASGVGIQSSTFGSSVTCNVTSANGVIYVAYPAWNTNGGAMSVTIDGIAPANDATLFASGPNGQTIVTGYNTSYSVFLARYSGYAAGTHDVKLTVSSPSGSRNGLMWVGAPFAVNSDYARVYVAGVIYQEADQKSAATAAYNSDLLFDVSQLVGDGLPVDFVDVRKWINPFSDFDGGSVMPPSIPGISTCDPSQINPLHPGNCGHEHIAQAFENYHAIDAYCGQSIVVAAQ